MLSSFRAKMHAIPSSNDMPLSVARDFSILVPRSDTRCHRRQDNTVKPMYAQDSSRNDGRIIELQLHCQSHRHACPIAARPLCGVALVSPLPLTRSRDASR